MATISARIDDQLKTRAEQVADSIGIPLSSAINIFLRRFVAERGFPFDVKALENESLPRTPVYDPDMLRAAVKRAVADPENNGTPAQFTYLDPKTQKPVTIINRKE